ncbi:hypothetical protein [Microbacterium sp. 1.5R]|uniref:hypothetical protein n=1 Tax=Microbacterium sp. 1.5R TaxID=1916917 RepID=UPI0011AAA2FC|nr:hypothetical protein [Microbacterium sp. 1.5R]
MAEHRNGAGIERYAMRIKSRSFRLAMTATVLTALMTGCSAEQAPGSSSPDEPESVSGMPAFQGNFAAEYQEAWTKSKTEDVKAILEDEQITDQEWSHVLNKLETCLDENGISLTGYKPDGSYEVNAGEMDGEIANQRMGECEEASGEAWVGYLYRSQTSNPENVPATRMLTECMIRNKAVPASYTEEQYLEDAPNLAFPFTDEHGFEIFESCNGDFSFDK